MGKYKIELSMLLCQENETRTSFLKGQLCRIFMILMNILVSKT